MIERVRSELVERPLPKWLSLLLVLLGIPFCARLFAAFGSETLLQDVMMTTFCQLYLADQIWQGKVRLKFLLPIPFIFYEIQEGEG